MTTIVIMIYNDDNFDDGTDNYDEDDNYIIDDERCCKIL